MDGVSLARRLDGESPFAVVLCGVPATGKSTFRNDFMTAWSWNMSKPCVVISTDDYIEQRAAEMGATYSDSFESLMPDAQIYAREAFKAALDKGYNLILDQTHVNVKSRRAKLNLLPRSYKKFAVAFELPREENVRRYEARERKMDLFILESMITRYVRPAVEEGFQEVFLAASAN